jgi:hypothetical protein
VLKALNMGSGFTHMEWFRKADGEVVFGEIGCRPGGAHIVDQMNYTSDIDLFREWARVVCHGRFEAPTTRKYNAAIIFKRAKGEGRITRIDGLNEFMRRYGEYVVEQKLLPVGAHRRDWKQTLLSDGHILLRHPRLAEDPRDGPGGRDRDHALGRVIRRAVRGRAALPASGGRPWGERNARLRATAETVASSDTVLSAQTCALRPVP